MSAENINPKVEDQCRACPRRSAVSGLLAKLSFADKTTPECDGPIKVSHGTITHQTRTRGEDSPPQDTWGYMVSSKSGTRHYYGTDVDTQMVCGQEDIGPGEGENIVEVGQSETERRAIFLRADTEATHHRIIGRGVVELLDTTF